MMADELKKERENAEFLRLIGADAQGNGEQQLVRKEKATKERRRAEERLMRYKRSLFLPSTLEDTKDLFRSLREELTNTLGKSIKYSLFIGGAVGLANAFAGPRSLRLMSFRLIQTVVMSVLVGANIGLAIGVFNGMKTNYLNRQFKNK